jgi:hypothetical protein
MTFRASNELGSLDQWQARRRGKLHRPKVQTSAREDRTADGITFKSKAELVRYQELKLLRRAGEVLWFIYQPPFHVLGVRVVADFLIAWNAKRMVDGPTEHNGAPLVVITIEDVKGTGGNRDHRARFERNRKQVREAYGIEIEEVVR